MSDIIYTSYTSIYRTDDGTPLINGHVSMLLKHMYYHSEYRTIMNNGLVGYSQV